MANSDYVQVPRDWIEKLKEAEGDFATELVDELQSGNVSVLEGDSVPRPETDESEILQVINQRDHWEEKATELAEAVGEHFGFSVGEHSSANCPVQIAIDALDEIAGAKQNASSSVKNDWESVKSMLAVAIVGFASRGANKNITCVEKMLDALTEEGTGFEYLRTAFQNTANPGVNSPSLCDVCGTRPRIEGEDWCGQCKSEFYDEQLSTNKNRQGAEVLTADAAMEAYERLRVNEQPKSLDDEIREKERIAMSRGIAVALAGIDFKSTEYHDIVIGQGGYEDLLKDVDEYDREHLLMAAYANLEKEEADSLMDKYGLKLSGKGSE